MKRFKTFAVMVGLVGFSIATNAQAQSSGLFGSRNVGGGTIQAGNRNTFGGSNAVGGTAGSRLDQIGNTGQITGSERFIRDNRSAGQFVGSDASDSAFVGAPSGGTAGATNFGFGGGAGGFGGFGNRGNATGRGQANRNSSRTVNVRTQLEIGFDYPQRSQATVQSKIGTRLKRLGARRASSLDVRVDGRTVILRGQVARASDRDLLVQLARLEPGVETVRDELTISSEMPTLRSPE